MQNKLIYFQEKMLYFAYIHIKQNSDFNNIS